MDSVVGLATQTLDFLCYSPPSNSCKKTVLLLLSGLNELIWVILFHCFSIPKELFMSVSVASGGCFPRRKVAR